MRILVIKARIWLLRTFFPEYERMSALMYQRSQEVYSLNNLKSEHVLLIETQTAFIKDQKQNIDALMTQLQEKQTQIVNLSKLVERGGKRRK